MREIKFRGKTPSGHWKYGELVMSPAIDPAIYFEVGDGSVKQMDWVYVNPDTIGQYTGLRDANGKEIYEGDIVRHPYIDPIFRAIVDGSSVKSKVAFRDGAFVICYDVDDFIFLDAFIRKGQVEVVGNIYDNPELVSNNF